MRAYVSPHVFKHEAWVLSRVASTCTHTHIRLYAVRGCLNIALSAVRRRAWNLLPISVGGRSQYGFSQSKPIDRGLRWGAKTRVILHWRSRASYTREIRSRTDSALIQYKSNSIYNMSDLLQFNSLNNLIAYFHRNWQHLFSFWII